MFEDRMKTSAIPERVYAALVELCRRNGGHVQGDEITSELLRKYHLSVRICEKIIIR